MPEFAIASSNGALRGRKKTLKRATEQERQKAKQRENQRREDELLNRLQEAGNSAPPAVPVRPAALQKAAVDPQDIELDFGEIQEDDVDQECNLNIESHRNYNTPEEMKKHERSGGKEPGRNFVIPSSLVNSGNPGERFDGSPEDVKN